MLLNTAPLFFVIMISIVAGGLNMVDQNGRVQQINLLSKNERWIMLAPLVFKIFFDYYKFALLMSSPMYFWLDGNPLYYQTIFDAPKLP